MYHALVATTMNLTAHTLRVVESPLVAKALNLGSLKILMRIGRALFPVSIEPSISGETASVSTMAHYTLTTTLKIKQLCSNSCKAAHPSTFSTLSQIKK